MHEENANPLEIVTAQVISNPAVWKACTVIASESSRKRFECVET